MTFEEAYERFSREIRRLSYSQYVPGMEQDDVESEMLIVLWKAVQSHDPEKGPLGTLWWSMWCNRRRDLIEAYHALKRIHGIPVETLPEPIHHEPVSVPVPAFVSGYGLTVWQALAQGDTATEVKADLGLSNRAYYNLIGDWRRPEVRQFLHDSMSGKVSDVSP